MIFQSKKSNESKIFCFYEFINKEKLTKVMIEEEPAVITWDSVLLVSSRFLTHLWLQTKEKN